MNEFVNFQKRGIELPAGCKDLIDVLAPPREAQITVEGLPHIERYLSRLLQSPAQRRSVWIISYAPVTPVILGLIHTTKGPLPLHAVIFVAQGRERPIRKVLDEAGIQLKQDDAIPAGDGDFSHVFAGPIPADVTNAARVVSDLLQRGYGLPADVKLEFRYREKAASQ